jgi:hypothetical protein
MRFSIQGAGHKYRFNFETGRFEDLPKSLARQIATNPAVARAIVKARDVLGIN